MKRKWLNEIIILLVTVLVLFFVLKDNFSSTIKMMGSINIFYFLLAVLMYAGVFTIEAYIMFLLIKEYKKNYIFKDSFKLSLMTKFFNGITPFSSGGRPLQVFELKKTGVRMVDGTNAIVQEFVIFQISLIIYSIFTFILNAIFKMFPTDGFLYNMTILGFIINIVILSIALTFSISKNLNKRIIDFFINSFYKIKLIKDKEAIHDKWSKLCDEYYNAFKDFKHKKDLILKCIIMQLIAITLFYLVVSVTFLALNVKTNHILTLIVASNFIYLTGCYIPIPGGSGGIEYAFIHYLESFETNIGILSSALIIWRFATYYLPTLVGGIIFNINKKKNQ